jgi:hypothetical protein
MFSERITWSKRLVSSRKLKSPNIAYGTDSSEAFNGKLTLQIRMNRKLNLFFSWYLRRVYSRAFLRNWLYTDGLCSTARRFDASWNRCTLTMSKTLREEKDERKFEVHDMSYKPLIDQRVWVKPFRDHLA